IKQIRTERFNMSNPTNKYLTSQKSNIISRLHTIERTQPAFAHDFYTYYLSVKNAQPRTVLGYAYDLDIFFYFLVQNNPAVNTVKDITPDTLNSLEPQDIQEYVAFLDSYEKDGKTYQNSATGKSRKLACLRSLYKYLQAMKMCTNNPMTLIPSPKIKKKSIIELENNELVDFEENIENGSTLTDRQQKFSERTKERDIAVTTLLLHTGLRISELVGLDLSDINWKDRSLRIIRKGGNESFVYMDDETAFALSSYINDERGETDEQAVFISRKGNRISVSAVQRMVKKYAAAIPNKHITPHKLRSTFATHLYRQTDDIYLVKDALGHKSVNTTAHYADIGDDRRKEVPDMISEAYKKPF
ncbi:MAG: tyrosine-type recombinase/integrase, partial [Candidatus Weimeria sp.]